MRHSIISGAAGTASLGVMLLATGCNESLTTTPTAAPAPAVLEAAGHGGNPHAVPVVFAPGVISTSVEEYHVSFTPDGRTVYFTRSDDFFPISRQATIMVSDLIDGAWTAPRVASFSGTYPDLDPFVSPDGNRIFFSSIRPVDGQPRLDADTWMVERRFDGTWSEPINLGPAVNSPVDDLYPSVDADGNLYFGSERAGGQGGWDIWRSRYVNGSWQTAENLGPNINSPYWDFNPWITADGRMLVFTSLNRPDGYGMGDIYVSHLHRGEWTPARNIGPPVNTAADEYHPAFSANMKEFYFVRHTYAPWVPGDIYTVPVAKLGNRFQPGFTISAR